MRRLPHAGLAPGPVRLSPASSTYLARVLRLTEGARVALFDPELGTEAEAVVMAVQREGVLLEVGPLSAPAPTEAPIVLVQGMPKGDKLADIVRDATELGATHVLPALCERSIARPSGDRAAQRASRLATVAAEAARQCGRRSAPTVLAPCGFREAMEHARACTEQGFLLFERATQPLGPALLGATRHAGVAFVVGPEGGFTDDEVQLATDVGYLPHSLGATILRTETVAAMVLGAWRLFTMR